MNKLYREINAETNDKYKNLRFSRIRFSSDRATVTVLCNKADRSFADKNLSELTELVKKHCEFNLPFTLVIDDSAPTAASVRAAVVEFTKKFPYVSSILHTIAVTASPTYGVKLKMHKTMYELAENDYIVRLKEYLSDSYVETFKLDVEIVELADSGNAYAAKSVGRAEYALTDVRPVIGALAPTVGRSIASIDGNAYDAVVCGIFAMPTEFTSKGGRKYEKFLLYDGDRSLQCRFFPNGGNTIIREELLNKCVCVVGNVEYDQVRNEASIGVRELSLCEADGLKPVALRAEPEEYLRVVPQPYLEYVQTSMFENIGELPSSLKGSFVVFDFETTGLSVLYDKPTEIGAVKVVDGKITDGFGTLIDPRRPIPPEVAQKTGITDDMVKGQPLFEDVIPDFYKFSYGCGFVCHNISFDYPFLLKGGNKCGYAFGDRRTFDTMGMAPAAFPGIQRVSLDKVLEELGLVNDNAHRAVSDAAATAKAFVAMNRLLAKK